MEAADPRASLPGACVRGRPRVGYKTVKNGAPNGVPMLSFEGVAKRFGRAAVLANLSFDAKANEALALLGANGSGKTTLLKMAGTLLKPTAGRVLVLDHDTRREEAREVRRRIGYVGHEALLYEELTARQNLRFFARLYQRPNPEATAEEWLGKVGLTMRGHDLVANFSRGMKQRLSVARAMLHDPDVLLLDEPFASLDDEWSDKVHEWLEEWTRRPNHLLLFATHGTEHVSRLATRAFVLGHGRLAAEARRTGDWGADYLHRIYVHATEAKPPSSGARPRPGTGAVGGAR